MKLKIAMIFIEKNDISRDISRDFTLTKSTQNDIYIKLNKILEKLNKQKIETTKIIPTIPQMSKMPIQIMTNQNRHVIANPNIISLS